MLMAVRSLLRPLTFASNTCAYTFCICVYGEHNTETGNRTSLLCISFVFTFTLAAWKQRLSPCSSSSTLAVRSQAMILIFRWIRVDTRGFRFSVGSSLASPLPFLLLLIRVTLNEIINWLFFFSFPDVSVRWYLLARWWRR